MFHTSSHILLCVRPFLLFVDSMSPPTEPKSDCGEPKIANIHAIIAPILVLLFLKQNCSYFSTHARTSLSSHRAIRSFQLSTHTNRA